MVRNKKYAKIFCSKLRSEYLQSRPSCAASALLCSCKPRKQTASVCRSGRVRSSIVIIILLLGAQAIGQVTTAFTYQGELERNDVAADGNFDFRFQLYDVPDAGIPLVSPADSPNVLVTAGLFTAEVDFGFNVFGMTDLWLEVQVRDSNTGGGYISLLPRQKITPTPVATHAMNVEEGAIGSAQIADGAVEAADLGDSAVGAAAINRSEVQARVTGDCPTQQAVRSVNEDGTVVCAPVPPGDITGVLTINGSGLEGGCTSGTCFLEVDPTSLNGQNPVGSNIVPGFAEVDFSEWVTIASVSMSPGDQSGEVLLIGSAGASCAIFNCVATPPQFDLAQCAIGFTNTPLGIPSNTSIAIVGVSNGVNLRDNLTSIEEFSLAASTNQTFYLRGSSFTSGKRCAFSSGHAGGIFVAD
ncbi:MAG: hypothetical protein AAGH65_05015 [Pseudomonadota bacterium]